jgi:hypothetical protein
MEETVPIIHSVLMRRNSFSSKNPYGVDVWYLCVTFCDALDESHDDSARNGA